MRLHSFLESFENWIWGFGLGVWLGVQSSEEFEFGVWGDRPFVGQEAPQVQLEGSRAL